MWPSNRITLLFIVLLLGTSAVHANYLTTSNGASGDGTTDDTTALQAALTYCSDNNITCEIPAGKTHYVTAPLFMWGNSSLTSSSGGGIKFNDVNGASYLFNLGIAYKQTGNSTANARPPFSGTISNTVFSIAGGVPNNGNGRIIYFWRSQGATISDNTFNYNNYAYGATFSGNNNDWLYGNQWTGLAIRKHVTITNNVINAFSGQVSSEGFSLNAFQGGDNGEPNLIQGNVITGVGDDPIGIHFSDNVKILSNTVRSTDGRIYVSNSTNIEIGNNKAIRIPSRADGSFYSGIGLIYAGFEDGNPASGWSFLWVAPNNINIHDNQLYFPRASIDSGAAIDLYGVRNTSVVNNIIVNDGSDSTNHYALILNKVAKVNWFDPSTANPDTTQASCQTTDGSASCIAKIHGPITFDGNISGTTRGSNSQALSFLMLGHCITEYVGTVSVLNNSYPSFLNFDAYKQCGTILTDDTKPNLIATTLFHDSDKDDYPDLFDNCSSIANPEQTNVMGNGIGDACTHGLTASYYNNKTLSGTPASTVIDPAVNFNWGSGSPNASVATNSFSARWTGKVIPPVTGTYTFCTRTDDGVRLSVNESLLVNKWVNQSAKRWCGTISLTQNQPAPIEMVYYENSGNAVAQLLWSYPGQTEVTIPTSQLYAQ